MKKKFLGNFPFFFYFLKKKDIFIYKLKIKKKKTVKLNQYSLREKKKLDFINLKKIIFIIYSKKQFIFLFAFFFK